MGGLASILRSVLLMSIHLLLLVFLLIKSLLNLYSCDFLLRLELDLLRDLTQLTDSFIVDSMPLLQTSGL